MIRQHKLAALFDGTDNVDWDVVYADQLPRVLNFFRYHVGDRTLAEDLTATTFEKAWRERRRYRRDLAAFSTWLFTIARNVATDHFRSRRVEVSLDAAHNLPATSQPDDLIEQHADRERLRRLLSELPPREHELIALKYGAGLTNRAIAQVTGLSETNVGTILQRTVRRLSNQWEQQA